jgi:hypothetical protein
MNAGLYGFCSSRFPELSAFRFQRPRNFVNRLRKKRGLRFRVRPGKHRLPLHFRRELLHAVEHHTQYRKSFHDEPLPPGEDRGIRLNLWEGLVESLPLSLALWGLSAITGYSTFLVGACVWPMVVALHHTIWNQIHLEMHKPEGRFFKNWAAYKFVARHHFLHHRYPDKNFNVALPVGDYIFGTVARPTAADWQAMRAEGIA